MYKSQGVFDRRMVFCQRLLSAHTTDELYRICRCDKFHCVCCLHYYGNSECHHYPVVFTDGACAGNGYNGAVSGIGGSFGEGVGQQWSIPVDDSVDPNAVRTNQRAELLAAIEGVRRLGDELVSQPPMKPSPNGWRAQMVVATDSEYVCNGVTEWMPKWKVSVPFFLQIYIHFADIIYKANGWRNSSGRLVSNKDLFCELDEAISALERQRIGVGFWWIARQVNVAPSSKSCLCSPFNLTLV